MYIYKSDNSTERHTVQTKPYCTGSIIISHLQTHADLTGQLYDIILPLIGCPSYRHLQFLSQCVGVVSVEQLQRGAGVGTQATAQ